MPLYEITGALLSSVIISPIMTCIDVSIIQSQMKHLSFLEAFRKTNLQFHLKIIPFYRPCFIMNNVYTSTYMTANLSEFYCKKNRVDKETSRWWILFPTSIVNIIGVAYKDIQYSKIFQTKIYPFHWKPYGLFAIRDMMTIGSSFILKKDTTEFLVKTCHLPANISDFISSLSLPIIAQIFSTPIHIFSIDMIQRPKMLWQERIRHIQKIYWGVCLGRIVRVIPAFGLGGFLNDMIKKKDPTQI
jgi:hypothetical protein